MRAVPDYATQGVANLIQGFWTQVRRDLHPEVETAAMRQVKAQTEDFIHGRGEYVEDGRASFDDWREYGSPLGIIADANRLLERLSQPLTLQERGLRG